MSASSVAPAPVDIAALPGIETDAARDRHFATDHLMADLKGRSVRGGAITLSAQAIKFILQIGSTMVLARLLTPEDFGLIAMVTAITGFAAMFKDAGLSMATVQRDHITHEQVSTLFWINVLLSVVVMIAVAALAPAIAWFYGEPALVWITLALAGTFIFGGLTVQHQALLRRQMRFTALAAIDIASMAAGIAAAIFMAILDFGYWSLVGLSMGTTIANCALVWTLSGWRPGPPIRSSGVRPMLGFGGGLTAFSILNYFTRNADNIIIGYAMGSGPLGVYSKAYRLLMMPIQQFNAPVASVMVPALSRLQSDSPRYRHAYLRAIGTLAFVGMPLVAFLFVVADEAVVILLGPGWEGSATVFRWLAPAAMLGTINVAPAWLCISLGRAKVQVLWAAISAPVTVVGFLIGVRWGIGGVAAAFSMTWCLMMLLFMAMACRRSPVSFTQLAFAVLPSLAASVLSAAGCLALVPQLAPADAPLAWRLVMSALVFGTLLLALTLVAAPGREQLRSMWRDGLGALPFRPRETVA